MNRTIAARAAVVCAVVGSTVLGVPRPAVASAGERVVAHRFDIDPIAVRSYWTRERMHRTDPLPISAGQGSSEIASSFSDTDAASLRIEPTPPDTPVLASTTDATTLSGPVSYRRSEVADPTAAPYRTAGRIFGVSADGSPYDCSATSVSSENDSVIWTAAHCIYHKGTGGWSRTLEFVPAYGKGSSPYGEWPVVAAHLSPLWIQTGIQTFDMAALVVAASKGGRSLEDVVGGRGFLAGEPPEQTFQAFGYPSGRPFDGERLHVCESSYGGADPLVADTMAIGCDMTSGSSGGGWIVAGRYLNSVISYGYRSRPNVLYGPYFGAVAAELHTAASTMPVPSRSTLPTSTVVGGVRHHAMRLTLRLTGQLRAIGTMRATDGFRPCTRRAPVRILRDDGGGWDVVGRTRTGEGGRYRVRLPNARGMFKAVSPRGSVDDVNRCTAAASRPVSS
ncbi:MAG TPA: hypothetical protein VG602_08305 [Actinomycetota bacterium]|nr:hypothetical protein [Actinomycetota bacterium]